MHVVFVGTGVSGGVPALGHQAERCACQLAMRGSRVNQRNNVSVMLRPLPLPPETAQEPRPTETDAQRLRRLATERPTVLIDCGKTFRDAYFRVLAPMAVEVVTAVLITHDHADAMMGLEELRSLQPFDEKGKCQYYIPCYLSQTTMRVLERQLPAVAACSVRCGDVSENVEEVQRRRREAHENDALESTGESTHLDFIFVDDTQPVRMGVVGLEQVQCWSFPVEHGFGYISFAYAFVTPTGGCMVYISDISDMPKASLAFLKTLPPIDVAVIDLVLGEGATHASHYCADQVMDLAHELQPLEVWGVGMVCALEHDATNTKLANLLNRHQANGKCLRVRRVALAFDGMEIVVP